LADDQFYIKSLTLENFRCFEKVELGPFDPHFNLLIGENGSGKSSVLLALAYLFRQLGTRRSYLPADEILDQRDVRRNANGAHEGKREWRLSARAVSDKRTLRVRSTLDVNGPRQQHAFGNDNRIIIFYDFRRQFLNRVSSFDYELERLSERDGAFANWLDAGISAEHLRNWFKDQTLLSLQTEKRAQQAPGSPRIELGLLHLRLVQEAVRNAIENSTLIEFDAEFEDIVVEFESKSRQFFREMSDGQRAFIGLVADIARRVCILNGQIFGNRSLLDTTGLVFIDEIELHLHPKWQRQILPALRRIFPKIQFFATTHSPQVIGEAEPKEVVRLTLQNRQKHVVQSYGMDSNWILECVMEAYGRDPEVAKQIKGLFDALDDGQFERARELIAQLRSTIGEAPDIVAAETYLWNLENDGEEAAE